MTVYGILGDLHETRIADRMKPSDCGNGKTNFMVAFAWSEFTAKNRTIVTNFHTKYPGGNFNHSWSTFMTAQEIFEHFFDDELAEALICISELSSILHSCARDSKTMKWVEGCWGQRRKRGYDIIWDAQRYISVDKIIRDHTDYYYVPVKFHCVFDQEINNYVPTQQCIIDNCPEKHMILVWQDVPVEYSLEPKVYLHAWEIGELYDTKEQIQQTLHVPANLK